MISRFSRSFLLLTVCSIVPTWTHATPVRLNTTITDVAGKRHKLQDKAQAATVLVFVSHDCPISNAYAPEISRMATEYKKRNVRFFVVYAEELGAAEAGEHARKFGYRIPLVLDNNYRLSHAVGARVTPEAAVLAPDGRRLYLGRLDDRYVTFGKKRAQTRQRDLREALDAVLSGKAVPRATTTAVGCFIPEATQ